MNKYSKDELEGPEWLNKDFLEGVLRQSEEVNNVKVINFHVGPATEKGNHFASIIFRIAVDYLVYNELKHISLILKTMPTMDGIKKDVISGTQAFETEIKMYSEVIPRFHRILREIGDNTILSARMIYSSLDPIKIIIFEDLTKQGYQTISNAFLEPHEIEPLLQKICRWHAISFKLIKEGDESINKLQDGFFTIGENIDDWLNDGITGLSKILKDQNIDPIYSRKFDKLKKNLIAKCKSFYQLQGNFCVLNHGDFHKNNLMIKMTENKAVKEFMMVDFQFCVAAPIAIDISYLLNAIVNPDCRDKRDEIIYKYHTLFAEMLCKLEYKGDIPTLIDLQKELMDYKELEIMMMVGFLPFLCASKERVKIDETVAEDRKVFLSFFEFSSVKSTIKRILPELLYKGYFD